MLLRLFFLLFSATLFAREVPNLTGPVVDEANLLSSATRNSLESLLYRYKSDTSNQIQVLIIESLEGDAIENYSIKVTDNWKLGDEKKDNGVLFLIAVKDRKMRIEVGQGLEGELPDALAGRIIDSIKPYFKAGNFNEGIYLGVESIIKTLKGEKIPATTKRPRIPLTQIIVFSLIILWFVFNKLWWMFPFMSGGNRHRGYYSGGGGFSGGGGSWSGGGGGFSGGGASGNW